MDVRFTPQKQTCSLSAYDRADRLAVKDAATNDATCRVLLNGVATVLTSFWIRESVFRESVLCDEMQDAVALATASGKTKELLGSSTAQERHRQCLALEQIRIPRKTV